jgi:hypothetical protein
MSIAYAKISLRGEQRALRERMHKAGMSRGQIAAEFSWRLDAGPLPLDPGVRAGAAR